jgi:hypothetical protein
MQNAQDGLAARFFDFPEIVGIVRIASAAAGAEAAESTWAAAIHVSGFCDTYRCASCQIDRSATTAWASRTVAAIRISTAGGASL